MMANTILQCYVCSYCDLKFRNSNDLDLHNQLHTVSGEFSCPLCKEIFPDLSRLQFHDLQHSLEETKDKNRSPSVVNISFIQPPSSFACKICNKVYLSDEELFDHVTQHAETENVKYQNSTVSSDEFTIEEDFLPSITRTVYKKAYRRSQNQTVKTSKAAADGPHECKTCQKVFNGPSSLNRHQRRFHLNKRKYSCTACHKTFLNLSLLSEHSLRHYKTRRQEFQCYICKKHSSSTTLLLEHIFNCHVNENKHFCNICLKFFREIDELDNHIEDHISAYNCDKCKKWYKTKSKLSNHRCVFDGPRPYPCKMCGKRFSRLYHLQRHCYMHDREQGFNEVLGLDSELFEKESWVLNSNNGAEESVVFKKKYECYMCNVRWYSFKKYKQHFLSEHKEVEFNSCPVCSRKFDKTYKVKRHLVTHSKEKLFNCNFCPKSFSVQSALDRHKKKHKGQEILTCYQCTNTFVNKLGFQKHVLMHEQGKKAAFKCTRCNEKFSKEKLLNNHILMFHDFFKEYK